MYTDLVRSNTSRGLFPTLGKIPSFDFNWNKSIEDLLTPFSQSKISLHEADGSYIVQVPLPGVNPDDVDITVSGRMVTITAQYSLDAPEGARVIWAGDYAGEIRESFVLPTDVYTDESHAEYRNGVLVLTLPKAEKTHKVKIHSQ